MLHIHKHTLHLCYFVVDNFPLYSYNNMWCHAFGTCIYVCCKNCVRDWQTTQQILVPLVTGYNTWSIHYGKIIIANIPVMTFSTAVSTTTLSSPSCEHVTVAPLKLEVTVTFNREVYWSLVTFGNPCPIMAPSLQLATLVPLEYWLWRNRISLPLLLQSKTVPLQYVNPVPSTTQVKGKISSGQAHLRLAGVCRRPASVHSIYVLIMVDIHVLIRLFGAYS